MIEEEIAKEIVKQIKIKDINQTIQKAIENVDSKKITTAIEKGLIRNLSDEDIMGELFYDAFSKANKEITKWLSDFLIFMLPPIQGKRKKVSK